MLIDPEYHKQRRNMVKSLFSTSSVERLSSLVLEIVRDALNNAMLSHERGVPLDIQRLYSLITVRSLVQYQTIVSNIGWDS
jgi:cytochrome P450